MTSVNYSKLENLLENQQWQEADQETLSVMSQVLPNRDTPDMVGDMSEFPCTDLQTIDQLWVKYSNGHFGFSVQKKRWESLGGKLDEMELLDNAFFDDNFAPTVGWKKDTNFLNWEELDYSLNAPQGQLPAKWVNSDTIVAANGNIYKAWKRLQHCNPSQTTLNPTHPPQVISVSKEQIDQATTQLTTNLGEELKYRQQHHKKNRNTYLQLSIASIIFTCLATIFGIIGNIDSGEMTEVIDGKPQVVEDQTIILGIKRTDLWKFLTPICTTIAATFQGAVLGFPVQQRAKFHKALAAQTDSLKSELEVQKYLGVTSDYLQEISRKLSEIKVQSSNEDGEANGKISTLTLEQINAAVAEMTKLKTELENPKKGQ